MADLESNFEGYVTVSEEVRSTLLSGGLIVFDTNVLLDLYELDEAARDTALSIIEGVADRLWVPHQVATEFWRNRVSRLARASKSDSPFRAAKEEAFGALNRLRPDARRTSELDVIKSRLNELIQEAEDLVSQARGEPMDSEAILRNSNVDPVLSALSSVFRGRVGDALPDDEQAELIKEGLRRYEQGVPPGYEDADKAEQSEQGTGDYLVWEQTLRYLRTARGEQASGLILVSNEQKPDWRTKHPQTKVVLGPRPEMVQEALARTGRPMLLFTASEFYREIGARLSVPSENLQTVTTASADIEAEVRDSTWTLDSYKSLLSRLDDRGYINQLDVILEAVRLGGFIDRESVYRVTGFPEERSLVRFSMPAARISDELQNEGKLNPRASLPLRAEYEGPGKARGYSVPSEFCDFDKRGS